MVIHLVDVVSAEWHREGFGSLELCVDWKTIMQMRFCYMLPACFFSPLVILFYSSVCIPFWLLSNSCPHPSVCYQHVTVFAAFLFVFLSWRWNKQLSRPLQQWCICPQQSACMTGNGTSYKEEGDLRIRISKNIWATPSELNSITIYSKKNRISYLEVWFGYSCANRKFWRDEREVELSTNELASRWVDINGGTSGVKYPGGGPPSCSCYGGGWR